MTNAKRLENLANKLALAAEYFAFLKGIPMLAGDDDELPSPQRTH